MDADRARHKPACPHCGYRLVGHLRGAQSIRCPECGERSTHAELRWVRDPRAGEWTERTGMFAVARSLALRLLVVLPVWAAALWLLAPLINWIPAGGGGIVAPGVLFYFPCIAAGFALGLAMSLRLVDAAGFTSWLLVMLAIAAVVLVVFGGVWIVEYSRPIEPSRATFIRLGVPIVAAIVIAWRISMDS